MSEGARELFTRLDGRTLDPGTAAQITDTYRFEIDGAGTWTVRVEGGTVRVDEGDAGEADCVISTSEETFGKIRDGRQNPMTAYMTGKVKVRGDVGAVMKLRSLF